MINKLLIITALTTITFQTIASNSFKEEFNNGPTCSTIKGDGRGNMIITNTVDIPGGSTSVTTSNFSKDGLPTNSTVFNHSGDSPIPLGTTSSSSHVTKIVNGEVVKDEKTETPVTQIPVHKN